MNKPVYLVKYALTNGIEEALILSSDGAGYVRLEKRPYTAYKIGRDVFETRIEAEEAADKMRQKRIASLEKQIAKLRKMEF